MKISIIHSILLYLVAFTKCQDPINTDPQSESDLAYSEVDLSVCNMESCPHKKGICYQNICLCHEGYLTVDPGQIESYGKTFCDYIQRRHYVALLLEFFLPIGIGHLYARKIRLAIAKFIFALILGGLVLYNRWAVNKIMSDLTFKPNIGRNILLQMVLSFGYSIFNLTDLICYGFNLYSDGNGLPLI